ncbi:MAG: hypothetical protein M3Q55_15265 [Acidobacteriota bacterium]|nr:hypothetical protein [Acidobacteriota bacterium]
MRVLVNGDAAAVALDLFSGGTFSRSTEGSYLTAAPVVGSAFLAWENANVRRIETRGDAMASGLLLEPARTNLIVQSRQPSNAAWLSGTGTTTDDAVAGPDGATEAARFNVGSGQYSPYQSITGTGIRTLSCWARRVGGTDVPQQRYLSDGASAVAYVMTSGAVWSRGSNTKNTTIADCSVVPCDGRDLTAFGGQVATAQDVYADLFQFELGAYPSSVIRTGAAATARGADVLTYASGSYPASFCAAGFRVTCAPDFASADIVTGGATASPVVWGVGTDNDLYFRFNGGVCELALARAGAVVASGALTFSRAQVLTLTYVPGTGVTVAGATTGNGLIAHAGSALPSSDFQVGHLGGANGFCGRFGRYVEIV